VCAARWRALLTSKGVNVQSATAPAPHLRAPGHGNGKLVGYLCFIGAIIAVSFLANYGAAPTKKQEQETLFLYSTAFGDAVLYALMLGIVLLIAGWRFTGKRAWRRDLLAWRPPRRWLRALGLAVAVLLVSAFLIALIDPFLHGGREQGVVPDHWMSGHAGAYAANWVVVAGVAPFVEETTYRGLGYSLLSRYGRWFAIVATGVLFAASHGLLQAFPELAILGFGLAWLRSRVDSVYPGMLVHSLFNSFALASVFWH
jgi:membrane protease YdiL (CAAX protease family)